MNKNELKRGSRVVSVNGPSQGCVGTVARYGDIAFGPDSVYVYFGDSDAEEELHEYLFTEIEKVTS